MAGLTVCGSYRRGDATIGDLDILVPPYMDFAEVMHEAQVMFGYQKSREGDVKSEGVMPFTNAGHTDGFLLLNFWYVVDEWAWAGMLLYATGPHDLNIMMRAKAKARGWKLSAILQDEHEVQLNGGGSEQEIFELLGMKFLEPTERSAWRNELLAQPEFRVVKVPSSTGSGEYNVSIRNGKAIDCNCKGFEYRNKCRHLAEAEKASKQS